MLAAIGQAGFVAGPIQKGRVEGQKDQRVDLCRSHVVCSWYLAGGGSVGSVVRFRRIGVRFAHLFVRLVGADVDQGGDVFDVGKLGGLAAAVECGDRQLNPAADDFCDERLFVQVAKVLFAQLVEGDQHVTEVAIQQLNCGRVRCWH